VFGGETGAGYTSVWWGDLKERAHLKNPRRRLKDNIKMGLQVMELRERGLK